MREEILRLIEKNSRIDIHEMAILLGAKEAEVANAIADMENEGVICGYYTLIDWDKTNDEKVTALIEVRVTPQEADLMKLQREYINLKKLRQFILCQVVLTLQLYLKKKQ